MKESLMCKITFYMIQEFLPLKDFHKSNDKNTQTKVNH